ncbi:glycosyltransferase family 2 protein [Sulfurospirillum diekertiae]|uniref:Glycosyltransferase family 2 protein n=1 Tax=Sulfurospirillum diekertiae TaxID=1854492 RepID=A0A6G9VR60_9BACT|nr:glycosyltransferase family 2 protein [Sulfurospirillum diekertiae]QIR75444.1 glycosyltransferase family 2 protein [Sulfurospirillum diekertiae]QIR78092.1 glycosyltransferase family 2 protein [Sulfurospirillum diekertiae]
MITNSLVIPVYKNELNIPSLLEALKKMDTELSNDLEVIFVVDGSPDRSYEILKHSLTNELFSSTLILLSKNFGSFPAIRAGLQAASGEFFAVMAADLQEPPELAIEFFKSLKNELIDVAIGTRDGRADPFLSQLASNLFWNFYKKYIVHEMPSGGIDVFGCNKAFRDQLLKLDESHSSLIAQIFWLGFRRKQVYYKRQERQLGVSAWTLKKKVTYMMDSIFSFTDLPIKMLTRLGAAGIVFFGITGFVTFISKLMGLIAVQGYTATFLATGFFGAINLFGLGIIGSYAWRTYENTKARPLSIILSVEEFNDKLKK